MKKEFTFKTDFATGNVILEPTQRLYLASGNVVRIWFTPKGQIMALPKTSLENGDVKLLEDIQYGFGDIQQLPNKPNSADRKNPAAD